jgi:nucleotide-binding universal stress UspA family protein
MTIRVVQAPVFGDSRDAATLAQAAALLRRLPLHVVGVHPRSAGELALLAATPEPAVITAEIVAQLERIAAERAIAARRHFESWCTSHDLKFVTAPTETAGGRSSAAWRESDDPDAVALHGRLSDLTVMARDSGDGAVSRALEGALFRTGRPLLLAPPSPPREMFGTALVAWNNSPEAARAVTSALPLLHAMQRVVVYSAGEERRTPGADVLRGFLAWHGIDATGMDISRSSSGVGADLLAEAHRLNAGLVVMGAYTHSRLRQLVFGGVTRHVLRHADLPVLLAH